jgi:hypothetical protein
MVFRPIPHLKYILLLLLPGCCVKCPHIVLLHYVAPTRGQAPGNKHTVRDSTTDNSQTLLNCQYSVHSVLIKDVLVWPN